MGTVHPNAFVGAKHYFPYHALGTPFTVSTLFVSVNPLLQCRTRGHAHHNGNELTCKSMSSLSFQQTLLGSKRRAFHYFLHQTTGPVWLISSMQQLI